MDLADVGVHALPDGSRDGRRLREEGLRLLVALHRLGLRIGWRLRVILRTAGDRGSCHEEQEGHNRDH